MTLALNDLELAAVTSVWAAGQRELTAAFGGTSMLPSIAPGERLVVLCGTEPSVGDVIAYLAVDKVVVHRMVAKSIDESWLVAWGDANAFPDAPFKREKLIGTVATIERAGSVMVVPSLPSSLKRRVMLRLIGSPSSSLRWVERRWRFLYRIRQGLRLLIGRPA